MKFIKRIRQRRPAQPGQSLVEFAIIVPILILLLLGVFEVGFALRNYLALANVNREATRFAARGIYLDFDEKNDPTLVGYDKVVSHTIQSLSGQLAMDITGATPNGVQIITYYSLEPTNFTCNGGSCNSFDCSRFDPDSASYVAGENNHTIEYPILHLPGVDPNRPAYYDQTLALANTTAISSYHWHQGAPDVYSRIDPEDMVLELRSRANQHNCELVKKNLAPTSSSYVVVENIFFQEPLVGMLPFIGDSVPMYTHTVMRVTDSIRDIGQDDDSVCELYPIMIPNSGLEGLSQGGQVTIGIDNTNNPVPGNFNWARWNADQNPANNQCDRYTICDNLTNPGNAATDFLEPDATPPDTEINVGDWVPVMTGVNASGSVKDSIDALVNSQMTMWMPVWYDGDCDSPGGCSNAELGGSGGKYRIRTFVRMRIVEANYQNNPRSLVFEYLETNPNYCLGDDRP